MSIPLGMGKTIRKNKAKTVISCLFPFFSYLFVYFSLYLGSQESYGMDIRISTISNVSNDSLNSNRNGSIPTSANEGRIRTNSSSSVKSGDSFYSVKSSATSKGGDGDFYSICSVDSFKST